MGAPKVEKHPVRLIGLGLIRVDHEIQSRVKTSPEYQREFSEAMLRGDVFPPAVVFWDGGAYWLADGFHRYGAAKEASRVDRRLADLRCEVREGTRREAMIYSAGANIKFSIPRTREDIKKAVWMLLEDPEWARLSNPLIAKHVGASVTAVDKYRVAFYATRRIPPPATIFDRDGKEKPFRLPRGSRFPKKGSHGYRVKVHGKQYRIGHDPEEAREKFEEILGYKIGIVNSLEQCNLERYFIRCNISFLNVAAANRVYPGMGGTLHGYRRVCAIAPFARNDHGQPSDELPEAVGRVLLARQYVIDEGLESPEGLRAVVLCDPSQAPPALLDLGRKLGVEFLTPEELVASIKGDPGTPGTPGA